MRAEEVAAFGTEQWLEFAARLHPLLLHFPIGLLGAAVILEAASVITRTAAVPRRLVHVALALAAVTAAGSGWLLGREADYAGELVDLHRLLGIAAAAVALAVAIVDLFGRTGAASTARRILLVGCCGLVLVAGHNGGMLTHGRTFVAEKAPPFLAALLGEVSAGPTGDGLAAQFAAVDGDGGGPGDAQLVFAALRSRCFECHGADKAKAGLRLDEVDGLLSVVDPGAAATSELLVRVRLPRGDEEAMPPTGAALDGESIAAIERWIDSGAPIGAVADELDRAHEALAAAGAALDAARAATGARIGPVAVDLGRPADEQRLEVDWGRTGRAPDAAALAALAPIAERVGELRLAGLALSGDLDALPDLPALESAHLERTDLGDPAVRTLLSRAPSLAVLNLHSTAVTSSTVDALAAARSLERVELFDTALDAADLALLAKLRPDLTVTDPGDLPTDPLAARPTRRILAADASKGRIALLREVALGQTTLLWEHPIEALHDMQWLGSTEGEHGRVLFQESWTRLVEVDTATGAVLWSYDAAASGEGPVEVHSFRRLDDDTTLVAESGRARLAFVDRSGAVTRSIPLTVDAPHPHRDTRLVRVTPAGTYLVAHERDGLVREYDDEGAVVWAYDVPLMDRAPAPGHGPEAHGDQVFCALRLADGDTLVSTGNGSSLLRVRPNGSLRWHLGQEDLFGVRLAWTTAIQELSNGNIVLGNCHAGPDQPQAIELTTEGELVWTFEDHALFGNDLSNLVVVEAAP